MKFHNSRIATVLALSIAASALLADEADVPFAPAAPAAPASRAAPAAPAAPAAAAAEAVQARSQAETERALAEAQQRLEVAAREVGELSQQLGNHMGNRYFYAAAPMRAQFGVQIDNSAYKDGAHILAVSPGGPAAEAGLRNGDIITTVAGEDLTKFGNPSQTLVERVREMQPDQKVKVTVLRAGKKQNFEVTARPMPTMAGMAPIVMTPGTVVTAPGMPGTRSFTMRGPQPGPQLEWNGNGWGGDPGMRFRGMEFATLSERLGSYFGVKSGVLVVRTGNNDSFKLQDGDVILSIDGREPGNAQHAGRILRSYRGGEKLTLRVQRDRKPLNIEVTLPGAPSSDDDRDD